MEIRSLHWINLWRFVAKLQPGNKRSRPLTHFNFLFRFSFIPNVQRYILFGFLLPSKIEQKQHLANILCILLLFSCYFFGGTRFLLFWWIKVHSVRILVVQFQGNKVHFHRSYLNGRYFNWSHVVYIYRLRVQNVVSCFLLSWVFSQPSTYSPSEDCTNVKFDSSRCWLFSFQLVYYFNVTLVVKWINIKSF